ncbi:MAG: hypothetical protein AAFY71_01045 [Bacteroidota bacterium]
MKLRIGRKLSQLIVVIYLGITFGLRYMNESYMTSHYWMSIISGLIFLIILYAFIKTGILNPGWFWFEKEPEGGEA